MSKVNKFNVLKNKKIIALSTLVAFCSTPLILNHKKANASMISRVGSVASKASKTIRGTYPTTSRLRTGSLRSTTSSNLSTSHLSNNLSMLQRKVNELEQQRSLEAQRGNHPLSKVVVGSGLVSGAMLVAGVVGGVIQQSKFMDLNKQQADKDQQVQQNLTSMRDIFNNKEVPEAEKHIINYYKDNFGIDITK